MTVPQANRARAQLMEEGTKLLKSFDAVLVPAAGAGSQGTFGNLIGIPEVVFLVGHHDIRGYENSTRKNPVTQVIRRLLRV